MSSLDRSLPAGHNVAICRYSRRSPSRARAFVGAAMYANVNVHTVSECWSEGFSVVIRRSQEDFSTITTRGKIDFLQSIKKGLDCGPALRLLTPENSGATAAKYFSSAQSAKKFADTRSPKNSGDVAYLAFLRCPALSFRSQASSTQAEKLAEGLSAFSCSTLTSISSINSCGNRIPLYADLLFLCPVPICFIRSKCFNTYDNTRSIYSCEVFKHIVIDGFRLHEIMCLNTLSTGKAQATHKTATPRSAGTLPRRLTTTLKGVPLWLSRSVTKLVLNFSITSLPFAALTFRQSPAGCQLKPPANRTHAAFWSRTSSCHSLAVCRFRRWSMRKGERIPSVSSSYSGRIVTTIQNGCFVCDRPLNGNEFIGTLETFLDLAKLVADPGGADTPDLPVTCTRRKAETLKPNNQRSVPSHRLPFVKSMSGHMNFWSVPATGEFAGGCQAGEALAKIYLKHLRENDYAGGCLQMIVADMCRQSEKCRDAGGAEADSVSGQIVGFFSVLDKWLHTAATMIGEPLDNLDVAALLSTANAGIRSAPETQG